MTFAKSDERRINDLALAVTSWDVVSQVRALPRPPSNPSQGFSELLTLAQVFGTLR